MPPEDVKLSTSNIDPAESNFRALYKSRYGNFIGGRWHAPVKGA
jgi:hypothetical protein